jgi:hypothetical protein
MSDEPDKPAPPPSTATNTTIIPPAGTLTLSTTVAIDNVDRAERHGDVEGMIREIEESNLPPRTRGFLIELVRKYIENKNLEIRNRRLVARVREVIDAGEETKVEAAVERVAPEFSLKWRQAMQVWSENKDDTTITPGSD